MGSEDEGLSIDKYFYSSVEDETYSDLLDFDDLLSAAPPPPLKRPCRAAASWLDGLANQEPVQKRQHQIQKQSQSFGLPFSQAYAPAQLDDAPRAFFGSESGVTQQAFRLPGPRGTFSVQEPFMVAMREGGGRVDDTTSPVGTGGGAVLSGRAADDPNDSFWKTLAGGLDPSWQDSLVPDPPAGSGGEELACDDGDHRDSLLRQLGLLGGPLDNDVASPGQLAGSRSGDGCCCAKPGSEAVLMDLTGAANRRLPPPPCQGSCACKDCELLAEVRLEWQHPQTSGPQVAGPRTYSCQLHGRHSHSGEGSHDLGSHSCVPAGGHKVAMDDAIALINHADGTVPGGTGTSEQDVFMPEPDLEGYEEEATVDPEFEERQVALEEPNASFDYSPRVSTSRHSSGSLDVPSSRGMGRDRRTLYHRTQSDGALPTSKSTTTLATTATTSTHPPMAEGTRGWQSLSALPPPAAPPAAAAAAVAPMPAAAPAPKQAASGSSSGGSDHNGSGRGQNGSGDGGGSKARPLFGASQSDRGDSLARRLADAMGIPFDPLPKSTSAPGPAPSAASAPLPPGALPAVSFVEAPLAQQRQQQHAVGGRHKPSSASLPELVQHGQSDAATHAGYVAAAPGGSTSEMDVSAAGDQPSTAVVRATAGAMKCVECTPLDLMLRRDLSALAEAIATDDQLEAPLNCTPARLPRLNVRDTRRYLVAAAAEVGLPFEYTSLETRLETLRPEMLGLRAGEALLVNGAMRFHTLTDGSVVRSSPRDAALRAIRQLEPRALVLGEKHVDQNGPFFLRRFSESLNFYSAVFDSIDAGMPAASAARHLFEKNVLGRDILNVVACEGLQRVARSEPLERWQERMRSAGFVAVPVKPGARAQLASTLEQYPHEGWSIQEEDKGALILCWKGRPIVATSIWRPAC
eukprot:jgi/Mesen1/2583/ME000164S01711